jgi:hypothetical protein
MQALKIQANKSGKRYALVTSGETFSVWAECENYAPHARGGTAKSWRYCEKGLTLDAAQYLFAKKTQGKVR